MVSDSCGNMYLVYFLWLLKFSNGNLYVDVPSLSIFKTGVIWLWFWILPKLAVMFLYFLVNFLIASNLYSPW